VLTAVVVLAAATVLVWRRAASAPPAYKAGTFFGALFLGGLLAPGLPALAVEGGAARRYLVPLALAIGLLVGIAACVRPTEEEWVKDE
jgi:hypothetical protein